MTRSTSDISIEEAYRQLGRMSEDGTSGSGSSFQDAVLNSWLSSIASNSIGSQTYGIPMNTNSRGPVDASGLLTMSEAQANEITQQRIAERGLLSPDNIISDSEQIQDVLNPPGFVVGPGFDDQDIFKDPGEIDPVEDIGPTEELGAENSIFEILMQDIIGELGIPEGVSARVIDAIEGDFGTATQISDIDEERIRSIFEAYNSLFGDGDLVYQPGEGYVDPGIYDYYIDSEGNPVLARDLEDVTYTQDGTLRDADGNVYTYPEGGIGQARVNSDGSIDYYVQIGEPGTESQEYVVLENEDGTAVTGRVDVTGAGIYNEAGELVYTRQDGAWVDAEGNILDDPMASDVLTDLAEGNVLYEESGIVDPDSPNAPTYGTGYTPRSEDYRGTIYGDENNPGTAYDVYFDGENIIVYTPSTGGFVVYDPEEAPEEVTEALENSGGGGDTTADDQTEESAETTTSTDIEAEGESGGVDEGGAEDLEAPDSSVGSDEVTSGDVNIEPTESESEVIVDAGTDDTVEDSDSELADTTTTFPLPGTDEYSDIISEVPGTLPSQDQGDADGFGGGDGASSFPDGSTDTTTSIPTDTSTSDESVTSGEDTTVTSDTGATDPTGTVSDTDITGGATPGELITGGIVAGIATGSNGSDGTGSNGSGGDGTGGDGTGGGGSPADFKFKGINRSIGYQPVGLLAQVRPAQTDYMRELNALIGRSMFGKMIG